MGFARWSAVVFAATVLAASAPARAVLTYDLLHDTPRTREILREDLSVSALAPREAAPQTVTPSRGEIETLWFAREKALQNGETERAQQLLQLLWEKAIERGIRNLPQHGTVLVREAERRMRTRDWEAAARALGWARRLAPDELSVYSTGAFLALRRNPLNLVPVWEELVGGARAIKRSFRLQVWLRANLLGTITAGLTLFFVCALATAGLTAAPRLAHDIGEALRVGSPRVRAIIAWSVIATPALVGLSPWWWIILPALLLWPYQERPARALAAAGAVFLLLLPFLVRERAALFTLPELPLLEAISQIREGHWSAADHAVLAAEAGRGTIGGPGVLALGSAARHLGRLDEAEAVYRAGLKVAPESAALWNNLGNVAFARQDVAGAIADYEKAVKFDGRLFAPHYNLGRAYRDGFKFAQAEEETRLAGKLDPAAAAFHSGLDTSRLKGATVEVLPAAAELWQISRVRGEEQEAAADYLWEGLMLGAPLAAWPAVIGALFLVSAALGFRQLRKGLAAGCRRCGRVFCERCQSGRRGDLCSQCHHIFVKKEGVDARVRVQKMGDIKAWRRRLRIRHMVCAALVPGGGHLSAGRFRAGLLLLLPGAFLEARVLLGFGSFPSPWSLGSASSSWLSGFGLAVLAALWATSLWLTFRLEE